MTSKLPRLILFSSLLLLGLGAGGTECCYQAQPGNGPGIDYSNIQFLGPQSDSYLPYLQYRYQPQEIGLAQAPSVPEVSHRYSLTFMDFSQLYKQFALYCAQSRNGNLTFSLGTERNIDFVYKAGRCQGATLYDRARAGLRRN